MIRLVLNYIKALSEMKNKAILYLILSPFLFTMCRQRTDSGPDTQDSYIEQKMTLEEIEKQDPLKFLSSNGTCRQNFFGRFVIQGIIINTATIAVYKDVVLEVSFYTKTETLLGTKQYNLYEFYPPGSAKPFSLKVDGFTGTEKIVWTIIQASNN